MQIIVGASADRVLSAAAIWGAATAARDGDPVIPPAEASVPILRAVLDGAASSALVTVDAEGDTVGFAVLTHHTGGPAEVAYLGVAPTAWGRGVAGQLLRAVEAEARSRACPHAELWVYADNARAVAVYEANGWAFDGGTRVHERSGRIEQRHRLTL